METTTQLGIAGRRYAGETDLRAICDLFDLCSSLDNLDNSRSASELRTEFESPQLDKNRDLRLWEDAGGRLLGFGHIQIPPDDGKPTSGRVFWRVHPEARATELGNDIIAWASERIRDVGQQRGQ